MTTFLYYFSVEHLNVKVSKSSFIIWIIIAETLRLFPKENIVYGKSIFLLFFFNR